MKASILIAAALSGLVSIHAIAAPPTDEQVKDSVKAYRDAIKTLQRGDRDGAGKAADAALGSIDFKDASLTQLRMLGEAGLLSASASKSAEIDARLKVLAEAKTTDGAEAALLRVSAIVPAPAKDANAANAVQRATLDAILQTLRHPSLQAALDDGKCVSLFASVARVRPDLLKSSPVADELAKVLTPTLSPAAAARLTALSALFEDDAGLAPASRDHLRQSALAAVRGAQGHTDQPEAMTKRLRDVEKFFDGAFAKGELLNHPAPPIHFMWSNSPATISSLGDLKGKVVLMDFWATWCGPCVGSFPKVRELAARYKDYPVVILGVTSIQGYHYDQKAANAAERRIDCKDDPKKEMSLMPKFIQDMEMTWTIAFSDDNVFNPSYGVFGIPHAVIIDPSGVLRHRGINPLVADPADEAAKIDALLTEFKLPHPDAPMVPAKPREKNGG